MCYTAVVVQSLSPANSFVTSWTVARQAPLSVELPRQEYRSGLLFSSPGDLSKLGIKPGSPALQGDLLAVQETKETKVASLGGEERRKWQPSPVFLFGKFHGQRSLVGYSPWGRKD